jgi:glycosyltransferase involved in cell wall biosynthesis
VRGYVQYASFDVPLAFRLLFRTADVVVAEPPPTTGLVVAVTSWLRRRPYVYYAADIWTDGLIALGSPRLIIGIMRRFEGWVLRGAARVLAVSEEVAQKVRGFGVLEARIAVVGNGIDTQVFRPDGPKKRLDGDGPLFVYTGIMSEWQDPSVFIRAMPAVIKRYPGARLLFVGHGSEEVKLKALARVLGLDQVSFGGVVPPARAAEWIRGATAALASIKPGLGYDFAKPTKIYAAAACGVPVIFAGGGAGADVVADNRLGWCCEHDADDVAVAMIASVESGHDGSVDAARESRVAWVRDNASITAAGTRAAAATLAAINPVSEPT